MKKSTFLSAAVFAYFILHAIYCLAQGTAINNNGATADGSAILDVQSDTVNNPKGILIPRMTTAKRNTIASPAQSLLIFNITTHCFEFYDNSAWQAMFCSCIKPAAPAAAAATNISGSQFTANWNMVPNASSYRIDVSTANNFSSFTGIYNNHNVGNVNNCNVTGLTNNTTYYYRIKAVNTCDSGGYSDTISVTTFDLLQNILAYWKFDESSGNAADATGNNNTLTNINSVSFNSGLINNCIDLGINNTNKVMQKTSQLLASNYSISMWVKINTELSANSYWMFNWNSPSTGTQVAMIYYYDAGTQWLDFQRQGNTLYADNDIISYTLGTSSWHHLVLTWDGSYIIGYIDGVAGTPFASTHQNPPAWSNSYLTAGCSTDANTGNQGAYTSAKIDEVGLWSRALSATEVQVLYNNGAGLQYPF